MEIVNGYGRDWFWQWDTGQKVTLSSDLSQCDELQFEDKGSSETIRVPVAGLEAPVPDEVLERGGKLRVYAYSTTESRTVHCQSFEVIARQKPDYPGPATE